MAAKGLLSVAEAQRQILSAVPVCSSEQIPVSDGLGRVLAEDHLSRRNQPPLAVSAMDGYAVRAHDVASLPATLRIIGYAPAGHPFDGRIGPGEAVRIFTGSVMPEGADSVVIQENTELENETVRIVAGETPEGRYVRPSGLDFREGDALLKAGQVLTARDVGLAASMNRPWLTVRRKPRIAVLATGDEIVMPGDPLEIGQIVSSNALALRAFITATGGESVDLGIAPDEADGLRRLAAGGQGADILLTTGGASVGDHDLVQDVLGDIGLEVDFWRIAMRPGKPLIFGKIGRSFLLGLPGNPVSSLVCAVMFLAPAIRKMLGMTDIMPRRSTAQLGSNLGRNDEREDYLRATLSDDGKTAFAFSRQDSSMFATMARAEALIIRPPHAPAASKGEDVEVIPLTGGITSI